jgi:hypothetical protein
MVAAKTALVAKEICFSEVVVFIDNFGEILPKSLSTPPILSSIAVFLDFIRFYLCFSSPENGFLKETRFLM